MLLEERMQRVRFLPPSRLLFPGWQDGIGGISRGGIDALSMNKWIVWHFRQLVEEVNAWEPYIESLTDAEVRGMECLERQWYIVSHHHDWLLDSSAAMSC